MNLENIMHGRETSQKDYMLHNRAYVTHPEWADARRTVD